MLVTTMKDSTTTTATTTNNSTWNQKVPNNRATPNNEPDIAFKDNETETRLLIESATAGDGNSMKKVDEENLKTLKEKYSFCGT